MSKDSHEGHFKVLWPRAARQVKQKSLAPRLGTLEGKTIAQLWDYLFRGDKVFDALEEGIKARYPGARFVKWSEFGNMHGANEMELLAGLPQRFKELGVDAAISAIAA